MGAGVHGPAHPVCLSYHLIYLPHSRTLPKLPPGCPRHRRPRRREPGRARWDSRAAPSRPGQRRSATRRRPDALPVRSRIRREAVALECGGCAPACACGGAATARPAHAGRRFLLRVAWFATARRLRPAGATTLGNPRAKGRWRDAGGSRGSASGNADDRAGGRRKPKRPRRPPACPAKPWRSRKAGFASALQGSRPAAAAKPRQRRRPPGAGSAAAVHGPAPSAGSRANGFLSMLFVEIITSAGTLSRQFSQKTPPPLPVVFQGLTSADFPGVGGRTESPGPVPASRPTATQGKSESTRSQRDAGAASACGPPKAGRLGLRRL